MPDPIVLEAKLDLAAASGLKAILNARDDVDTVIDMSQVKLLGALCLQVLMSAAKTANAQGRTIRLTNVSDRILEQMRLMGVTPETIARER